MGCIMSIIVIGGIITGIYWYKKIDVPRGEHYKKDLMDDVVVLDINPGEVHGGNPPNIINH